MSLKIINSVLVLLIFVNYGSCHYSGPFLMWGVEELNKLQGPALNTVDDEALRGIFSNATAIVIFLRNSTTKLNQENFPRLSEMVGDKNWLYLPQMDLLSDPLDHNIYTEVINLSGPPHQQDVEITALFKHAQVNYENKNVLGVLATKYEDIPHSIYKREVTSTELPASTTPISTTPSGDEPQEENLIYLAKGRGMLYTTVVPGIHTAEMEKGVYKGLKKHSPIVTADERDDRFTLFITFFDPDTNEKLPAKFRFKLASGYWTMNEIELDSTIFSITGEAPLAPLGFSYRCSNKFIYKNGTTHLKLENIQVQPFLKGDHQFSDAYDCVGFFTAPILSGVFVTFIVMCALSLAITTIIDIKTPNRFENRSGKPLTFTVQE